MLRVRPGMTLVSSFPPLADPSARILILGSMPGVASLNAGQYYAHPRNHFWAIMCDLFRQPPILSYQDRCRLLADHHIAVWDVLSCCTRQGSLDSAIRDEIANDFNGFLALHPHVHHIFFNGAKAASCFGRLVRPNLNDHLFKNLVFTTLPSTSPANASYSFIRKRDVWQQILPALGYET